MWKISLIVENVTDKGKIFACGKIVSCEKPLWSRKKSLLEENFLDQGKNLFLWKTSWRRKKSLFEDNFLDQEKILICKSFFDQGKCWLVEKFFDRGKIIGLSLLKIKLCHKTNSSVETIKIHIFRSLSQTLDPITFLLTKNFSSTDKLLSFCVR